MLSWENQKPQASSATFLVRDPIGLSNSENRGVRVSESGVARIIFDCPLIAKSGSPKHARHDLRKEKNKQFG